MEENQIVKNMRSIAIPLGTGLVLHPITSCRVLMQLGYEPDPPFLGHTFFSLLGIGKKEMKLPSIFTYSLRVVEKAGWSGLFLTGLPAKLCYTNLSSFVTDTVCSYIIKEDPENTRSRKNLLDTDKSFKEYLGEMSILAVARISGVLVSYPIEVIMIRQVAQILEEDGAVTLSMMSWFVKILKDEGIIGFYGGVSSKIFGELVSLTVAGTLLYGINNYVLNKTANPDVKQYMPAVANIIATPIAYKYSIISALLAVSGSGLLVAMPFNGFSDTYGYLRKNRGFNRGSSLLLRYA